jgi:hypothetical protein
MEENKSDFLMELKNISILMEKRKHYIVMVHIKRWKKTKRRKLNILMEK